MNWLVRRAGKSKQSVQDEKRRNGSDVPSVARAAAVGGAPHPLLAAPRLATLSRQPDPATNCSEPHIPLGTEVPTGEKVAIPLSQLQRPVHIQGGTGERKTLLQAHFAERWISLTDAAVGYCDFSEDQAAANYVLDSAERAGRKGRLLSTVAEHASAWFDPMKPIYPLTEDSVVQAKDFFMAALSLAHSGKYEFWGKVNDISFLRAFKALAAAGITSPTVEDVRRQLESTARGVRKQDTVEAVLELEQLATQRVLYPGDPADEIDYDRVLEKREVVYLLLGVLLNSAAGAIGALNVWGAVAAAIRRKRRGLPSRRLVLIIDEYAMVAHSAAYRVLVVLCRKFGITLIIANQSTQQLKESGNDQTVFDSTATKLWMSPLQDDIDTIRGLSKDVWKTRNGRSFHGLSVANQISEYQDPVVERNDVIDTAFTPMEGFLIEMGRGHREPRRFRFEPPWTVEQWEELGNRPLPMREDTKPGSCKPRDLMRAPSDSDERKKRLSILGEILAERKEMESWEAK